MKRFLFLIAMLPLFAHTPNPPVEERDIAPKKAEVVIDTFYHSAIINDIIRREGLHKIINDSTVVSYDALVHDEVIGFGHHDPYADTISISNAFHLMLVDLKKFQEQVQERYPKLDNIQSLAIAMLAYNCGINCIEEQLDKELKEGKNPITILKYQHYNGIASLNLRKSRELEYAIFTKDTIAIDSINYKNCNHVTRKFKRYEREHAINDLSNALQKKRKNYTLLAGSYFPFK